MKQSGYTLLELMVTLAIGLILTGMAYANLKEFSSDTRNAANELASFVKQVRARALSSAQAYTIMPSTSSKVIVKYALNCATANPTLLDSMSLTLPGSARMSSTAWSLCYSPRGLSDNSVNVVIQDGGTSKTVQIVLGGGVRVI